MNAMYASIEIPTVIQSLEPSLVKLVTSADSFLCIDQWS